MFRHLTRSLVVVATALALAACDDASTTLDPNAQAMAAVAGDYAAAIDLGALSFTTDDGAERTDWLAAGATIELRLTANGKTTGRLFVPGVDEDGGDLDEDLAGTWSLDDGVIVLDHEADTFLRDMPFRVQGKRLVGEATFDEIAIRVELARR